ncbi:hypothetical protein M885DRAFT_57265 [Pelagophyceae sp. CCMP2097]|nr:hypothetical protein M885DRAFT_57265 [Pelagophyceae sp. CCMP2097]
MKTRPGEYEILRATEIVRVKAETATATRTTVVAALKWRWTAEMDEVLVECLDEAPPEETFSTAVDLYVARNVDGPCRDFVEVRLALLCELNELAAPLLPLVGSEGSFGDEDAPARLVSDGMSFLAPHGAADLSVCIRAHAFRISAHLKLQLVARHVSTNHVSTRRPPTDADDADDADDAPANAQPELRLVDAAAIESAENAHHGCLDAAWWKRERWLAHSFVGQTASQLAERTAAQTHHACRGAMDAGGHAFTVAMIRADGSPAASAPNDALAAFFARVAFEAQEALLDRGGGVQGSFAEPPTCGERRPLVAVDASRLAAFRTLGLAVSLALRSGTPLPLDAAPHVWAAVVGAAPRGTGDDALGRAAACLGSLETCGVSRADAAALFGGAALAAPLEDGRLVELCEGGLSKPLSFDGAQSFAALLVSARRRASAPELAALRAGAEAAVPRRLLSLFTARQLAWRLHAPTAAPL